MKMPLKLVVLIAVLIIALTSKSQENQRMDTMPFQLGFITPMGTNGMQSWNTVNNVSLNIFAGYAGGLDGFEATGFVSVLKSDMKGAQISGFVNADLGKSQGGQFAGFVNYNKGEMKGVQFAGFVNTVTDNAEAFQAAGFVNTVVGEFEGAQFAGFVNVVTKNTTGAQFAGFVNAVSDSLNGFQGAGFVNYSMGNTMGQISGFTNVNIGNLNGVQATGFVNVNTGRLTGAQLAGFVNVTQKLKGTQIGIFNFVDSLESGTPIGLFSFVRNGYRTFEFGASETLYGMVSFKTGTHNFYNIISLGGGLRNDKVLWGWGYGIGSMVSLSDKMNLTIEAQSFHMNENVWHTNNLNLWNTLSIVPSFKILPNVEVFAGPSFNVVVSSTTNDKGEPFNSSIAPFNVFSKVYSDGTKVEMYPGFTAGIRF